MDIFSNPHLIRRGGGGGGGGEAMPVFGESAIIFPIEFSLACHILDLKHLLEILFLYQVN